MKIGALDTDREVLLIAEIGNNHEGNAAAAAALAERALDCGAHIVKFQLIEPERLVSVEQTERVKQLSRFKLPVSVYQDIAGKVHARGGVFMASAFDVDTLAAILPTLDAVKIASGDLDFDPLLALAAKSGKPVVLSTGMATLPEIEHAVTAFHAALPKGARLEERLALLHCVSLYPTKPEQANLEGMATLQKKFGLVTGYSDHVLGIDVAVPASSPAWRRWCAARRASSAKAPRTIRSPTAPAHAPCAAASSRLARSPRGRCSPPRTSTSCVPRKVYRRPAQWSSSAASCTARCVATS
jgi:N,N'-diacetyllegionaminate synthase